MLAGQVLPPSQLSQRHSSTPSPQFFLLSHDLAAIKATLFLKLQANAMNAMTSSAAMPNTSQPAMLWLRDT